MVAALPLLACPHCTLGLDWAVPGVVGCANGHRFDVARRGYLSLLGARSRTDTGDSAEMVAARVAFLGARHYRPIADAVAARVTAGPIVDIGAGTGYYLAEAVRRLIESEPDGSVQNASLPIGVALDASRYAAGRSAVAHPGIGAVLADAWSRLPVRSGVAATVINIFAPRDPAEIARLLAPEGRLIVVTPEPDHLAEIRGVLGLLTVDPGKADRLVEAFAGLLRTVDRTSLRQEMVLTHLDVLALVRMGPSARHLGLEQLERAVGELAAQTTVKMSVTISVLQRS